MVCGLPAEIAKGLIRSRPPSRRHRDFFRRDINKAAVMSEQQHLARREPGKHLQAGRGPVIVEVHEQVIAHEGQRFLLLAITWMNSDGLARTNRKHPGCAAG